MPPLYRHHGRGQVLGASPLSIPWGFLPPQTAFAASGVSRRTRIGIRRFDRPLTMPAGVVLLLTVLTQTFLPMGFITHGSSVRRRAGQWLTHQQEGFQKYFMPVLTHIYDEAARFSDPPGPLCTNLHNFLFIYIHFYARMTVWHIAFASERLCAKYACI